MKLLLTSGGLRNQTIIKALLDLAGKPANKLKFAFIPTAQNVEAKDKTWLIDQLIRLKELEPEQIDIVDFTAIPKDLWLPKLQDSNVIFVNGGNTTYLMESFKKFGLSDEIKKLLENRVYVGVSAGSYIATPDIRFNSDYEKGVFKGLNLVDFGLQVHYKNPKFPLAATHEQVAKRVKGCPYKVYVLDDQMAVKVNGSKIEAIGEGEYEIFEPS
jgi:dipeptidase E